MRLSTLKKRAEFQRVRGGGRWATAAFVLEGKARMPVGPASGPRFGFTVTKKLGKAVVRNRIRRRLRAALSELAQHRADPCFDYVVIARNAAFDQTYALLKSELQGAFQRVHAGPAGKPLPARRRAAKA